MLPELTLRPGPPVRPEPWARVLTPPFRRDPCVPVETDVHDGLLAQCWHDGIDNRQNYYRRRSQAWSGRVGL